MTPHTLHLFDLRHGKSAPVIARVHGKWTTSTVCADAFVFPSFELAHRYAQQFLRGWGQIWMPLSAAGRVSSVGEAVHTCATCGCTDEIPGPDDMRWIGPAQCSGCVPREMVEIWTVWRSDLGLFTARKLLDGIPTEECVTGLTLEGVRLKRPPCMFSIPLDEGMVVETWHVRQGAAPGQSAPVA